jgi:drug/metabolite transporter (DMT)-like permease
MRAEKADCLRLLTAIAYSRSLPYWPSSAFNFGVRTLGVVTGTAFLNVVPVSAMLMSAALGAPPAAHELLGVAMVVSALLIHTLAQQRSAQCRESA